VACPSETLVNFFYQVRVYHIPKYCVISEANVTFKGCLRKESPGPCQRVWVLVYTLC